MKGEALSAEQFADFKRYMHSQQGDTADHTNLPRCSSNAGVSRLVSLTKLKIQSRLGL